MPQQRLQEVIDNLIAAPDSLRKTSANKTSVSRRDIVSEYATKTGVTNEQALMRMLLFSCLDDMAKTLSNIEQQFAQRVRLRQKISAIEKDLSKLEQKAMAYLKSHPKRFETVDELLDELVTPAAAVEKISDGEAQVAQFVKTLFRDDDGPEPDPADICKNDDCGHPYSFHVGTGAQNDSDPCTVPQCKCEKFVAEIGTDPN